MSLNSTELLDQFILESRECLERVGQRLLDVEKAPQDTDLLNDLFRQVHTLKGNCGLFEFKALELVVHAGEDVLDRIRNGRLSYSASIADALLEAMDYTASLIDVIETEGPCPTARRTVRACWPLHCGTTSASRSPPLRLNSSQPAAPRRRWRHRTGPPGYTPSGNSPGGCSCATCPR